MIYTVTFNPSLDYILKTENLHLGRVNRSSKEKIYPGGKGINVSIMLKNLGIESHLLGFVAGFTGLEIVRQLSDYGCYCDFITLKQGVSRINVKIKSKMETEINGQGPIITDIDIENLMKKLDTIQSGDILVLAGSIPESLPKNIYEKILIRLTTKQIDFVADATGELLLHVLSYHPFLIKPNHHELAELFGQNEIKQKDIPDYARKLQQMGAKNVLISMAGDGAILLDQNGSIHKSNPPKGIVVNSVGAGDSMIAGFLAGYMESSDFETAFKMGLCSGSATAFQEWLADKQDILRLMENL